MARPEARRRRLHWRCGGDRAPDRWGERGEPAAGPALLPGVESSRCALRSGRASCGWPVTCRRSRARSSRWRERPDPLLIGSGIAALRERTIPAGRRTAGRAAPGTDRGAHPRCSPRWSRRWRSASHQPDRPAAWISSSCSVPAAAHRRARQPNANGPARGRGSLSVLLFIGAGLSRAAGSRRATCTWATTSSPWSWSTNTAGAITAASFRLDRSGTPAGGGGGAPAGRRGCVAGCDGALLGFREPAPSTDGTSEQEANAFVGSTFKLVRPTTSRPLARGSSALAVSGRRTRAVRLRSWSSAPRWLVPWPGREAIGQCLYIHAGPARPTAGPSSGWWRTCARSHWRGPASSCICAARAVSRSTGDAARASRGTRRRLRGERAARRAVRDAGRRLRDRRSVRGPAGAAGAIVGARRDDVRGVRCPGADRGRDRRLQRRGLHHRPAHALVDRSVRVALWGRRWPTRSASSLAWRFRLVVGEHRHRAVALWSWAVRSAASLLFACSARRYSVVYGGVGGVMLVIVGDCGGRACTRGCGMSPEPGVQGRTRPGVHSS